MNSNPKRILSKLVVVTSNYPSPARLTCGTFVREFAHAVSRKGIDCTVIHPIAFHDTVRGSGYPARDAEEDGAGRVVNVFRPRFLSLSTREQFVRLGSLSPSRFTLWQFTSAVRRVIKANNICPDAFYGHFLYMAGAAVVRLGVEMGISAFPCVGEGELWTVRQFGVEHAKKALKNASGFLANSTALKQTLVNDLGIAAERIGVFPNGTDLSEFKPINRESARKRLGLPLNQFLVAAVGNFLFKKGIVRVGQAIDKLDGVAGVFAGSGPVPPCASNMALCRRVSHEEIPVLLSASDVFVLPTLIEGSCNALVEAMACGLPIISSTGEFNDDLLDDTMSIRIDPMDTDAIRHAIVKLKDDPALRTHMAMAALQKSKQFEISDRVDRIITFLERDWRANER